MSAPAWASDDTYKSFTSIFGTALHGSEITWYNKPEGTEVGEATEMKMKWVQNMHSILYTWYDSNDADDPNWFVGDKDLNGETFPFNTAAVAETPEGTDITHLI